MNPYQQMVDEYARLAREGRQYPLAKFPRCPRPQPAVDAPKALIFSPHPDDEAIIGGWALRLLRKSKWNVIDVAVTLGSNPGRRAERRAELQACCDFIGFGLQPAAPDGLEKVHLQTRAAEPGRWAESVKTVAAILDQHRPRAIFLPHEDDWNSTHIGTAQLVRDALKTLPPEFACAVIETEYWRPMSCPNVMVELSLSEVGDLVTALTFHCGEVRRNPYHLSLPAWMMDNVRRGGELIGGQGAAVPGFLFATLYRLSNWSRGELHPALAQGRFLASIEDPAGLF
jgi:LmbE family N-acetylglucosaminyl deacetylase